ncbi:MAG: DUF2817 domain-containing protein [Alphaproteobacteria bacterium]|nr:DUF2817 domain-containing protein [Alphaproteobacteria bacterium]
MRRPWRRNPPPWPDDTALTLIHLINPFGCAWDRRENEDNADLFRNFIYRAPPYPENAAYDEIAAFLNLVFFDGPVRVDQDRALADFAARAGHDELQRIMAIGTHRHRKGIKFNGDGSTWSRDVFDTIVDGWLSGARRMVVIDVHTGFGPPGAGLIMTYDPPAAPERRRLARWLGDLHQVGGGQSRLAVHRRMPYHGIADRLPGAAVTVVAPEFGTDGVSKLDVNLVREENYIHNHGDPSAPVSRRIRARMRARYYVETPDWKEAVIARGLEIFDRTKAGLAAWARAPMDEFPR